MSARDTERWHKSPKHLDNSDNAKSPHTRTWPRNPKHYLHHERDEFNGMSFPTSAAFSSASASKLKCNPVSKPAPSISTQTCAHKCKTTWLAAWFVMVAAVSMMGLVETYLSDTASIDPLQPNRTPKKTTTTPITDVANTAHGDANRLGNMKSMTPASRFNSPSNSDPTPNLRDLADPARASAKSDYCAAKTEDSTDTIANPDTFVYVIDTHFSKGAYEMRMASRNTWLRWVKARNDTYRFFLWKPPPSDRDATRSLEQEMQRFQDIVLLDFHHDVFWPWDSNALNLTTSPHIDIHQRMQREGTLIRLAFHWALTNIPEAATIVKADYDTFVCVPTLKCARRQLPNTMLFWGRFWDMPNQPKELCRADQNFQVFSRDLLIRAMCWFNSTRSGWDNTQNWAYGNWGPLLRLKWSLGSPFKGTHHHDNRDHHDHHDHIDHRNHRNHHDQAWEQMNVHHDPRIDSQQGWHHGGLVVTPFRPSKRTTLQKMCKAHVAVHVIVKDPTMHKHMFEATPNDTHCAIQQHTNLTPSTDRLETRAPRCLGNPTTKT